VVPIFANGLRAFGIIYLAHLTNDVTAVEADHIVYGWGFFTAVLLLQIAIGMRFADKGAAQAKHPAPLQNPAPARQSPSVVVAVALALAALGPAYLARLDQPAHVPDLARAAAAAGEPLPPAYHRLYRIWFAFGFPAFSAVIAIIWLMVARPVI